MPHLHILFDFLSLGRLLIILIQGREIEYVSPIFYVFMTETAREISALEGLMVGAGVPVIMTEVDDIHLVIL
jgi:hypothetical protein